MHFKERFTALTTATKKAASATARDKVTIFCSVGLRPKRGTGVLNIATVVALDNYFQLAIIPEACWCLVVQCSTDLQKRKKEVTSFTFPSLQGCSEEMKLDLLQKVVQGALPIEKLRLEANHVKAVEKLQFL